MKLFIVMFIAGTLCTGCAFLSERFASFANPSSLRQADAKMVEGDYRGAASLYSEFVKANPDNPQAARASATQTALERLVTSQTELERVRRDASDRAGEADRLKGEVTKLRADLERLRAIDLNDHPAESQQ